MAYNFKNLADVELLNTMPEQANVLVEVNGTTKRAPQVEVDVTAELIGSEALEEVPEGATVFAEVNGQIKRVPSNGLGGGKALIIKSSDFDNAMAGIAAVSTAPADTYSANMTFDEVMEAFAACELNEGFVFDACNGFPARFPIFSMAYDINNFVVPCLQMIAMELGTNTQLALFWTAANGVSTTAPASNNPPT